MIWPFVGGAIGCLLLFGTIFFWETDQRPTALLCGALLAALAAALIAGAP